MKTLYLERSLHELKLAKILFNLSEKPEIQASLGILKSDTFYSATITHAYYSIFYAAKAYLISKKIQTKPPEEHKKTLEQFQALTESGEIDLELFKIYESICIKADSLLGIFSLEKRKRGKFTYYTLPEANKDPAKESVNNSELFYKNIYNLCLLA